MVSDIWQQGYPSNIPASLGQFWQDELISDLIENITSGSQTCLSLDTKMITAYGLNPMCSENVPTTQSKAHLNPIQRGVFFTNGKRGGGADMPPLGKFHF